jgi:hypothetical protein
MAHSIIIVEKDSAMAIPGDDMLYELSIYCQSTFLDKTLQYLSTLLSSDALNITHRMPITHGLCGKPILH